MKVMSTWIFVILTVYCHVDSQRGRFPTQVQARRTSSEGGVGGAGPSWMKIWSSPGLEEMAFSPNKYFIYLSNDLETSLGPNLRTIGHYRSQWLVLQNMLYNMKFIHITNIDFFGNEIKNMKIFFHHIGLYKPLIVCFLRSRVPRSVLAGLSGEGCKLHWLCIIETIHWLIKISLENARLMLISTCGHYKVKIGWVTKGWKAFR